MVIHVGTAFVDSTDQNSKCFHIFLFVCHLFVLIPRLIDVLIHTCALEVVATFQLHFIVTRHHINK